MKIYEDLILSTRSQISMDAPGSTRLRFHKVPQHFDLKEKGLDTGLDVHGSYCR